MNRKIFITLLLMLCSLTAFAQKMSAPANWKLITVDHNASGEEIGSFEINLNSLKKEPKQTSVQARITSHSIGTTGYNCSPGELRHQNIDKSIEKLVCNLESSTSSQKQSKRDWKLISTTKTSGGRIISSYIDLNDIDRINDTIMTSIKTTEVSLETFQFDCKGYYKGRGQWETLDMTDHLATVPIGYVSPERKTEQEVCAPTLR